jgi:hypothetical protein
MLPEYRIEGLQKKGVLRVEKSKERARGLEEDGGFE